MGTTAIISAILAVLSTIGGITAKQVKQSNDQQAVNKNGMASPSEDSTVQGVNIASDVTGIASQALGMLGGLGNMRDSSYAYNANLKGSFGSSVNRFLKNLS